MDAGGVFSIGSSASNPILRLNYAGSEWPSAHYVSRRHRSTCVRVHALINVGRGWGSRRRWQLCANFSEFFGVLRSTGCLCACASPTCGYPAALTVLTCRAGQESSAVPESSHAGPMF